MSWLTNFVRPKLRALIKKSDSPNNLWIKCNSCDQMVYHKDLFETMNVCPNCDHHMKMTARQRIEWILDEGTIKELNVPEINIDPLKFRDSKRYLERLKDAKSKTNSEDAIIMASGQIGGNSAMVVALDFNFMGGSMGSAVGEGFLEATKEAVNLNIPLVIFTSSGGARMQEGIFSLMQLPKTVVFTRNPTFHGPDKKEDNNPSRTPAYLPLHLDKYADKPQKQSSEFYCSSM